MSGYGGPASITPAESSATFSTGRTTQGNSMVPELVNEIVGTLIEVTNGGGIFVERALYSDASGVVWAAGTNALATRLP